MVAGEASGDQHGAHVIRALQKRHRDITIRGAGGEAMRKAGAEIIVDDRELSVMGFTAVLSKAPQILKAMSRLKRLIARSSPDLLILIDFPDFNLHLAGYAKKMGVPVLYYISPQVWAWRSGRLRKIKRRVDHMAVILPFEKSIYERHNMPVTFVGHPLMDAAPPHLRTPKPAPPSIENQTVALLPGSRKSEVSRLLPEMLKAAQIMQAGNGRIRFEISRAPSIDKQMLRAFWIFCVADVLSDIQLPITKSWRSPSMRFFKGATWPSLHPVPPVWRRLFLEFRQLSFIPHQRSITGWANTW